MHAATIPWIGANAEAAHDAEMSRSSLFTFWSSAWQQLRQALPARKRHAASTYVMLIERDIPGRVWGMLP